MPTPLERKLTPADRVDARPFHEPQGRAGVSPASVGNADGTERLALARSLGRRDACPTLGALRFKVPIHAQKRKEALHELERGAPAPPGPARPGHFDRAGLEPRAPILRFMVPMPAQEPKEALPLAPLLERGRQDACICLPGRGRPRPQRLRHASVRRIPRRLCHSPASLRPRTGALR